MSEPKQQDKPFDISKWVVWEAYQRVKANKGAAGVDEVSIAEFEQQRDKQLYRIWNRLSSGSYFPPPVKAVEIPKPGGKGVRILGVPTVADRVAQTVAALALESRTESIFHGDSYGYRPGRSPLMAVSKCRERCWKKDWVIDLDVRKFFDSVDHDLMVKAVAANITPEQRWVVLYVKRWLKAPVLMPDGRLAGRHGGTPQGSAVSPVLANLFMHYALDSWLEREFPAVEFERFADDAVVHCATERQARQVLDALGQRMAQVGLALHPEKTKIVSCKDRKRHLSYETVSFTFLGYTFRARKAPTRNGRSMFAAFLPAVSRDALKKMGGEVRHWRINLRTTSDIEELAEWMNPVIRGWMTYYGKFYRTELNGLLRRINTYLVRWARRKFRRLRSFKRARRWWNGLLRRQPGLFTHWAWMTEF